MAEQQSSPSVEAKAKPGLTAVQWQRIFRAIEKNPEVDLRALIDKEVRLRMAMAWKRGADAGWAAGVSDALDDDPKPLPPNPYEDDKVIR